MKPAGLAAYSRIDKNNSYIYSFEQRILRFDPRYEEKFKKNKKAWNNFQLQAPYYRKTVTHWVMSAKQEKTRLKRLNTLIKDSKAGLKIKAMRIGRK